MVRDTIAILKCVMLTIVDGNTTVETRTTWRWRHARRSPAALGSSRDAWTRRNLSAGGCACLPAEAEVTLEFGSQLVLRSKGARVALDMLPASDFPAFSRGRDYACMVHDGLAAHLSLRH